MAFKHAKVFPLTSGWSDSPRTRWLLGENAHDKLFPMTLGIVIVVYYITGGLIVSSSPLAL